MRRIVIVNTVVCNKDEKILILTRTDSSKHRPGDYDFPGGKVDPGEDLLHAAARELFEETAIRVDSSDLEVVNAFTKTDEDYVINLMCFIRVDDPGVTLSEEHVAYRWMSRDEVMEYFDSSVWAEFVRDSLRISFNR